MKISLKITKALGKLIAGDTGIAPYLTGPQLVEFFNECGYDDVYEQGFPSRWIYATEKLVTTNGSDKLRKIFEEFMDPRRYNGDEKQMEAIAQEINHIIKYDGYAFIRSGDTYRIADIHGNVIEPVSAKAIGHEFISEQIDKCHKKIHQDDYNGAITNARTLTEAILIHVIESVEGTEVKNDGNLIGLWSRAKKALKIDLKKDEIPVKSSVSERIIPAVLLQDFSQFLIITAFNRFFFLPAFPIQHNH